MLGDFKTWCIVGLDESSRPKYGRVPISTKSFITNGIIYLKQNRKIVIVAILLFSDILETMP